MGKSKIDAKEVRSRIGEKFREQIPLGYHENTDELNQILKKAPESLSDYIIFLRESLLLYEVPDDELVDAIMPMEFCN